MSTKKNRTYPKEFKEEAVALVTEQGYSVTEAARSLGITTKLIYNWKQKIEAERSGTKLSEDERSELIKLRRENKQLLIEREILKKASAFFAKEMK
tara:strand:- start:919 stop:1206 length:288 start_codon:yes stop_codon:yes gene_type:complete